MTDHKKRIVLDTLNIGMTGATLVGVVAAALWMGGILQRLESSATNALTVQDGMAWEREAMSMNPTLRLPDIRDIHAQNMEQAGRSVLR